MEIAGECHKGYFFLPAREEVVTKSSKECAVIQPRWEFECFTHGIIQDSDDVGLHIFMSFLYQVSVG